MSTFTNERSLRSAIDKALREHDDCDLALRIRKELRRTTDSNTTNRNRALAEKEASRKVVSDWAFEHMALASDDQVRAEEAFEAFRAATGSTLGKRAFYDALRADGWRLVKCDYSGRESLHGPLTIMGAELLP